MAAEPSTEKRTSSSSSSPAKGTDSFFSQKWGPLPAYGWFLLAAGGAVTWWYFKNRSSSSSTASTATGATGSADQGFDYGPSYAAIQSEVQNLQGSESTTSTAVAGLTASVKVPDVVGDQLDVAEAHLSSAGFDVKDDMTGNNPPKSEHVVTAQSPEGGATAKKGSTVTLTSKAGSPTKTSTSTSGTKPTTSKVNPGGTNKTTAKKPAKPPTKKAEPGGTKKPTTKKKAAPKPGGKKK